MKILASFLASVLLAFSFAGTAEANRPIPGYPYKQDVCANIAGKQSILDVTGISARYRFKTSTPQPNDCVRVRFTK